MLSPSGTSSQTAQTRKAKISRPVIWNRSRAPRQTGPFPRRAPASERSRALGINMPYLVLPHHRPASHGNWIRRAAQHWTIAPSGPSTDRQSRQDQTAITSHVPVSRHEPREACQRVHELKIPSARSKKTWSAPTRHSSKRDRQQPYYCVPVPISGPRSHSPHG